MKGLPKEPSARVLGSEIFLKSLIVAGIERTKKVLLSGKIEQLKATLNVKLSRNVEDN